MADIPTGKREPAQELTFKDVWTMFQETDRLFKELREETNRRMQETDRQMKETDRRIQETDRQLQETDRQLRASKKELDKKLGDLGNRFGELAEHMVAPSIKEKFNALGFHFGAVARNWEIQESDTIFAEIDILLANDDFSIAVEVKSKPSEKDIDAHLRRIEILRRYADKHHDTRKIRGAVAGAIMSGSVRRYALEAGFYVIVQTGDTVKIDIPQGFTPREW
ncbi:MAG: hypothetical protein LBQ57_02695 [Spirochaetales bacterium]|nr:hypothetical protein [Spirochaetales bacterium]